MLGTEEQVVAIATCQLTFKYCTGIELDCRYAMQTVSFLQGGNYNDL